MDNGKTNIKGVTYPQNLQFFKNYYKIFYDYLSFSAPNTDHTTVTKYLLVCIETARTKYKVQYITMWLKHTQ